MKKRLYSFVRKFLSIKGRGYLTHGLYVLGIKPTVQKGKSPLKRAVVVFSADFEMAWAFRYSKTVKDATEMGLRERNNFSVILRLFNNHNIPVTWATVGHLFLGKCEKVNGIVHSEMERPAFFENRNWLFETGDWYDQDPCTDYKQDPAWYAPDLIEKIIDSPVNHEIACHTFSHIDFSYENCPSELAESELKKCIMLATTKDIVLKSMVFPGGSAGNFESLKNEGFLSYRKPMKYDVDIPVEDNTGLIAIPSSYSLDGNSQIFSAKQYLNIAKSFVEAAVKYKLVCHFWFHPSMNFWYLKNVLPDLLSYISELRSQNEIDVLTMGRLAERMLKDD